MKKPVSVRESRAIYYRKRIGFWLAHRAKMCDVNHIPQAPERPVPKGPRSHTALAGLTDKSKYRALNLEFPSLGLSLLTVTG